MLLIDTNDLDLLLLWILSEFHISGSQHRPNDSPVLHYARHYRTMLPTTRCLHWQRILHLPMQHVLDRLQQTDNNRMSNGKRVAVISHNCFQ